MEILSSTKEIATLSSETAESMVLETITLLTKSMNLLDIEPENPSARFNIHHGFKSDIKNCQDIIKHNTNVSDNRMKQLSELFYACEQRRISYCLKHKDTN